MSTMETQDRAVPSIYIVDDEPHLTELYAILLETTGYIVKTFNDRESALAALKADRDRPDLLITDYRGMSMPVDLFLHQCLTIHPELRILMVSGFILPDLQSFPARPDRLMQKPFTAEEFREEVRAALVE